MVVGADGPPVFGFGFVIAAVVVVGCCVTTVDGVALLLLLFLLFCFSSAGELFSPSLYVRSRLHSDSFSCESSTFVSSWHSAVQLS